MVHGCHSSSLESQETATHPSSSFSCCTYDPQPRKMSCPSVISTSGWQLWDSPERRHEDKRGQPWLCWRGTAPRKPHAGIRKAAPALETQDAEKPPFLLPWEHSHLLLGASSATCFPAWTRPCGDNRCHHSSWGPGPAQGFSSSVS